MESNLLTVREVAQRLDLPIGWLRAEAVEGRLPYLKVGRRRLLFNLEAVERVLLERAGGNHHTEANRSSAGASALAGNSSPSGA